MTVDLAALPSPGEKRLAVRITKDALRHLRRGHPWVFDGSITSVSHDGEPGDLAVVFDDTRAFAGIGLWDPASPMRIKVLHAGSPRTIDGAFWSERVETARAIRQPLIDDDRTDAYRLIHGENDGLPGVVLDWYAGTAVLKVYTAAWLPHLRPLIEAIVDSAEPTTLIVRFARSVAERADLGLVEGAVVHGPPVEEPVMFLENGLRFEAHPTTGQKTGHFLDQRVNRARVRELAAGRRVLDVFSCTGGFSVHAAAGGATEVHSVDLSGPAIEAAIRNMGHNAELPAVAACRHEGHHGDAFEVMRAMAERGEQFDLVVIDPPSFAQRQASVDRALAAYARLTRLGLALTETGGTYVQASCSSRVDADTFFSTVRATAADEGVVLDEFERTTHPLDHPIGFAEGGYLKALYATIRR
ncbi:MAG: class I SAM-dependent rRNA methyltransferase [Acidimicrobiales bacterium]|nr:class I SAM-dependent rRNA methyltransferase [Acidimicrobiales bacterium]